MAKSALRLKARELRTTGLGIKTIAYSLQVSSSTVSLWCRDIELTEDQKKELSLRSRDPYYGRRMQYLQRIKAEQKKRNDKLLNESVRQVGKLTNRSLFIAGVGLYWAEGFKKDNLVGFSNTDPEMIIFFIRWLEECCGVTRSQLKLRLGVNEYFMDKTTQIEEYWSKTLGVSSDQFQKPYFQKVNWKKAYENSDDYHGVLRVRVAKSTILLRKILGWIEGLRRVYRPNVVLV